MSRGRVIATCLIAAALIVLLGWQLQRERLVKACLDAGAHWDGARSACRPLPLRPILQRDLHRS
jgi:hypothetical protein